MTQDGFNKILLSAVDEGLCLIGDSSKHAIFSHWETSFQLEEENTPYSLTKFKTALEGIFGPGATYLEKVITKRLYEKLDLEFEEGRSTDFLEYVKIANSRVIPRGIIVK